MLIIVLFLHGSRSYCWFGDNRLPVDYYQCKVGGVENDAKSMRKLLHVNVGPGGSLDMDAFSLQSL